MSCGRIALKRTWLPVASYYASEINRYPIQVSKKNYPSIIHIGDVTKCEYRYINGRGNVNNIIYSKSQTRTPIAQICEKQEQISSFLPRSSKKNQATTFWSFKGNKILWCRNKRDGDKLYDWCSLPDRIVSTIFLKLLQ